MIPGQPLPSINNFPVINEEDAKEILNVRDWLLIPGKGGYKTGGGACEVLPRRKGGSEKGLAMLKGKHKKFWGSFSHIKGGGAQNVSTH